MTLRAATIILLAFFSTAASYRIELKCNESVVKGASLRCVASVYDGNSISDATFRYTWRDNALPDHRAEFEFNGTCPWIVHYPPSTNPGLYVVRVTVCRSIIGLFCKYVDSVGTFFNITETLNGKVTLTQGNVTRDMYVSSNGTTLHNVTLNEADAQFVAEAPKVLSYWFVDCVYYGIGYNLDFAFNYTKPDVGHTIEALVEADFTPPPVTTTPATTTTSTIKPNVTSTPTKAPNGTVINPKVKRSLEELVPKNDTTGVIMVGVNGTLVPYNGTFPYICGSAMIATDSNKTYGYFKRGLTVKAPISGLTVSGNNWLQRGELLSLNVKCSGSQKMLYCLRYIHGLYNVTGNETCGNDYMDLDECNFPIKRYLPNTMKHTVLIILKNDVSKVVTPVTVTVYQVKPQGQLSIIVVPVAFSLVAVVLIVFGVAYYFQNRSRFVVEVADFNFGQQYADMDYKTFKDRLKESLVNALTRDPMPSTADAPGWSPTHKYGSMT
ncbi:uncharacterized protein LOC132707233 [Cylas formicarius]|uniref:uncharacterized protein LOC132707233 n=1 Tax=Cylas formicarius TaxID=197179 RepID=UPI00295887D1|nr:uncharacterized protein LOC132707233 [Cylas formicarius]